MKKAFKRTIACLLAVLMIISSLPFTVFAEDNSVQPVVDDGVGVTCDVKNYGVFTDLNGGSDRFKANNWINITNDATSSTFTIGYINFDISGIKASEYDDISASYEVIQEKLDELVPLQVMYPTKNQDLFDNQTSNVKGDKLNDTAFNSIWKDGGYAQNAKDYFGLSEIGQFEYEKAGTFNSTIDVGSAVKYALKAGLDYATVVFIVAKKESGKFVDGNDDSHWTDTKIYLNDDKCKRLTNVTVTESTTVQKPASLTAETANVAPKAGTSGYSIGGVTMPSDYSNNVLYCSSGSELIKTDPNYNWLFRFSVAPYNTVLMYDGQTNPAMPIMFGLAANGEKNIKILGAYLDTTWAGSNFEAKSEFKGYKQAKIDGNNIDSEVKPKEGTVSNFKFTSGTSFDNVDKELKLINYEFSGHYGNKKDAGDGTEFTTKTHPTANGAYYWWNKMDYVGSVNTDTYFQKFTNPVIKSCSNNDNWGWSGRHEDVKPNNSNIYVLNYKPIYDVLKNTETVSALGGSYTFKDLYNNVWGHESDFASSAAISRYYSAVEKLISIDPQAELANCADDQVESKVKELGEKIKTAYNRYVSAAQDLKYKTDWNAYHDATALVSAALNQDRAQYTEASINDFEAIVNPIIDSASKAENNPAIKQADIDNFTSQLLSALSMLRKKDLTITIEIYKNGNCVKTDTKHPKYGDSIEINSEIDPTKESVKGWVVRTDGKKIATKVDTIDSTFTLHATKDAIVEAYVVPLTDATTTYSKVIFYGFNGRVIDVKYLESGKTLVKDNYTTAPTVPFYSFTKWSAESVTGNGKDIIVRANYSADTSAQQCNVHYERFVGRSKQYSYDQYVYLPDVQDGEYFALSTSAEATEDTILTYLNGREFHVPMVSNIYVVKVNAADRKAKVAVTGSYATTPVADKNRAVFNCKFYLPEGCEAVEWGAKISANNRTKVVKSDKNSKYNEYSIYMDVPKTSSIKGFTAVAYVTYRDSTGTTYTTIESKPVTQALN